MERIIESKSREVIFLILQMCHLELDIPNRKMCHLQWDGVSICVWVEDIILYSVVL